jgi:antitoxin component YwqK of YwqJK toxin-antitoxin module
MVNSLLIALTLQTSSFVGDFNSVCNGYFKLFQEGPFTTHICHVSGKDGEINQTGPFLMSDSNGKLIAIGQLNSGKRDGLWIFYDYVNNETKNCIYNSGKEACITIRTSSKD